MTGSTLHRRLSRVAGRVYRVRLLRRQALIWLLVLIPTVALSLMLPDSGLPLRRESVSLILAVIAGLLLARWSSRLPSWLETARLVEQHHPELSDMVLTAVRHHSEQADASSVLTARLLREADDVALVSDWKAVVPAGQIVRWSLASILTFAILVSSVFAAGRYRAADMQAMAATLEEEQTESQAAGGIEVDPGDTEIERGTGLTIVARFGGSAPTHAVVEFRPDTTTAEVLESSAEELPDEGVRTLSMKQTVDEGVFAARIPAIDGDGSYVVSWSNEESPGSDAAGTSETWRVSTFVRPRVVQVDAVITPPDWTGRPPSTVQDTVRLAAVEGSDVRVQLHLNKPVSRCVLESKQGELLELDPTDPLLAETIVQALENETWNIRLEDAEGRTSAEEMQVSLRVIRNKPPKIQVKFPQPDLSVSSLQELLTEAVATDDFGILDYGIVYSLSGESEETVSLRQTEDSLQQTTMNHMIDLESLEAQPNELLTWHFFAEAHAANGEVQRAVSDLMFADVRRFEEIFREQKQPPGQGGGPPPQQSDGILKIQRQIALAIWNLQQSTAGAKTDGKSVSTIVKSQQVAIGLLEEMKQDFTEEQELLDAIEICAVSMDDVLLAMSDWSADAPEPALTDAAKSAQAALRELLKLRAVEHRVSQSQSTGGGGGQQQLDQLELENDRNRYETESKAELDQEEEQQKEQLQILNQLKEIARRQDLLNERLKQLTSELRNAETEEEKERLERELKRLRDEQRDLLRDVDELRERLDQSSAQNEPEQQQMREDVDEARENVRQAAQAMDAEELSEALSEALSQGTRAEREFNRLKEEFRRQTSTAFGEAARELRQQARELSERQKGIARNLAGDNSDAEQEDEQRQAPTLRTEQPDSEIPEQFGEQRERLQQIVEQAKELVEQAEASEPLLARRLFEAVQKSEEFRTEDALRAAELLANRGLWRQVAEPEQAARRGIEDLKNGIELAAEAVLGSEAEALQQAQNTLEGLSEELAAEISEATGQEDQQPEDDQESRVPTARDEEATEPPDRPGQPSTDDLADAEQQAAQDGQPSPGGGQPTPDNSAADAQQSFLQQGGQGAGNNSQNRRRPLTGGDFRGWSDGLREVEEVLEDPDLRHRVARIRDRARSIRADYRRHGKEPQWSLVESNLLKEMESLRRRLVQEISALTTDRNMVPIDREPVPEEFDSLVQRYYELLGQEQELPE